ncbi:TonB-dependent receptor domain-containing protein [Pasteurella sp. PK-2025]|uniref:TonB-dependent receptor domain-containing protein n=1 Tax=Pasteurella sp. PK-2025 TaxID=3413133 RepID=UPI003C745863
MSFKRNTLTVLVAQACCFPIFADSSSATLEPIVVSGINQTGLSIDQSQLEKENPKDLKEIFTSTPGVNVTRTGYAQLGEIEIRGMGTGQELLGTGVNRVTMELDGMDITSGFYFGHASRHGRQYFDPSDLKQVEIHKGPNSNGVAGYVRFQTKDPADYIQPNRRTGAQLRAGYLGDSDAYHLGVTGAALLNDKSSALVSYTRRWFNELNNKGAADIEGKNRTKHNPSSAYSNSVNSKLIYAPNDQHKFTLNLQHYDLKRTAIRKSDFGLGRGGKFTHNNLNIQKNARHAIAFSHDINQSTPFFDSMNWHLSFQKTKSENYNKDNQTRANVPQTNSSIDGFKARTFAIKTEFNKSLGQDVVHELSYGLKWQHSQTQALRQDQLSTAQKTQSITRAFFPKQKQWQTKIHLSDRINFGKSGFSVTPSVHLTHIKIKPETDNMTPKEISSLFTYKKTAVGYGLRLDYALQDTHLFSLSYQRATRLPGYGENNAQTYGHWPSKPNPTLKPETSEGVDFTWRSAGEIGQQTTTLFYNKYTDLIFVDLSICYPHFNRQDGVPCELANEKGRSYSYGIEFDGKLSLDTIGLAKGMYANGGFAYIKGKDAEKQPQARLDPFTGFIGIGYKHPIDVWGVESKVKFAAKKKTKDLPKDTEGLPGYGVWDLTAYYNLTKQLYLGVGIYNVLDKKYARWAIAGNRISNGNYEPFTEAGRHFGANLRYNF